MVRSMLASLAVPTDSDGPFDLVNGLPAHPLVVHAAVVLVPLTALGVIVMAFWPRFSQRHGWLVVGSAVVAAVSSFVAKESGEALAERLAEPRFDHGELGELMPAFAAALVGAVLVLWLIDRRAATSGGPTRSGLRVVVAVVAVVVAAANVVWIVRVGDSGAKSVWSGVVAAAAAPSSDADPLRSTTAP